MSYTRYLLIATIIVAAVVIAASAPRGMSVLEMTATLNSFGDTQDELDTFVSLAAHSTVALDRMGRTTLIPPTDAAFETYFAEEGTDLDTVLADQSEVDRLVLSHMIRGQRNAAQLEQPANLRTRAGTSIESDGGRLIYEGTSARIIRANANAGNGVVHVIDGVLA